jgi:hypothetical protein
VYKRQSVRRALVKESNKLKSSAHQKPATSNPGIIASAIKIIKALITRRNNPKVKTVKGIVSRIRIGLMVRFSRDSTRASITAAKNPST